MLAVCEYPNDRVSDKYTLVMVLEWWGKDKDLEDFDVNLLSPNPYPRGGDRK